MPRLENHDDHGDGVYKKKQKNNTIDKFMKGRQIARIEMDTTESAPIQLDTATQSIEIFGQIFDANGYRIRHKPHLRSVENEDDDTAVITAESPLPATLQVLYKIVPDVDDDEETVPL